MVSHILITVVCMQLLHVAKFMCSGSGSPHNIMHLSSNYWGEHEQAPHRCIERNPCLSVCMHISYCKYTLLQMTEPERLHASCESQSFSEHGGVKVLLKQLWKQWRRN